MNYEIIKTKTVFQTSDINKQGPLTEINIPKLTENLMPSAQRVCFIINKDSSEEIRGKHYHSGSSEILLCAKGQAFVEIHSKNKCEVATIDRDNAIFIPSACWHAVRIEKDSILLAIAEKIEEKTTTINELLNGCSCKHCGQLLLFKKEIEIALAK